MEVILLKEVKRLGLAGEVKRVTDGYARNYLIPRGLAVPASDNVRQMLVQKANAQERHEASEKTAAVSRAASLQNIVLTFTAKTGESGRLYGSITSADIAAKLSEIVGEEIDKRKVSLVEPIKEVGQTSVEVKLHAEVKIKIRVIVNGEPAS
ncbi:MAG: 50S ribosomal protein L9 [Anaerolineae bacterium]